MGIDYDDILNIEFEKTFNKELIMPLVKKLFVNCKLKLN